jgi:sugar phosphate isomerase/epimerase
MKQLKLAVQEQMVPGKDLIEKFEKAVSLGFDAIELRGKGDLAFEKRIDELFTAKEAGVVMPTVCVEMKHFIGDFDDALRRDAINNMKSQISTIVQAGGFAAVTPASWGKFSAVIPSYGPAPRTPEEDRQVLLEALRELGEHAKKEGGKLLLEPLNRYENHMVNTIGQALDLIEETGLDSLGVVADTYQMNISEDKMDEPLLRAGKRLVHLQASDSNRFQPGIGHLDWKTVLQTLRDMDYDGFVAFECLILGEPEAALKDSAAFLRDQWSRAAD